MSPFTPQSRRPLGLWTTDKRNALLIKYQDARAMGLLSKLAEELGVDMQQLYSEAHRLGLSREIRRR